MDDFYLPWEARAEDWKEHPAGNMDLDRLREICRSLIAQGAHNLNFVNPTHYVHVIAALLKEWRPSIPVVFNTGGYDKSDTLRGLEGKVGVYLPT